MKPSLLRLCQSAVLALLLFFSCQKPGPEISFATNDQQLIASARQYFEQSVDAAPPLPTGNPRLDAKRAPYWPAAYAIHLSQGTAVIVPLFYETHLVVKASFSGMQVLPLNQLTKLIIYKDASGFHNQVITLFPDSNWRKPATDAFSGYAFSEAWQGQPLTRYRFSQGLILKQAADQSAPGNKIAAAQPKQVDVLLANCGTISGYNYSASDPSETYSWSEPAGCDYEYLADPEGPGLPPARIPQLARPNIPLAVTITPPTNIIANIQDYIKCFSNYGGSDHTYTVTVCVDQPDPGTREAWALTSTGVAGSSSGANPVDAGHTFLVLSENFSGYSIVRNIGFYPQTNVYPWASSAQGQLNDDDGHSYNISLTITVNNGQFFNILNYISQGNNSGYMYDLNTNNCTSFALHALQAGNINLPATVGSWPDGGFGYDPGDLGEDIRNMQVSSNMTRNTTYNDHPNKYNCP